MDRIDGRWVASASDLVSHLACGHVTALERARAAAVPTVPPATTPTSRSSSGAGSSTRRAYLATLRHRGLAVVEVPEAVPGATGRRAELLAREAITVDAMRAGTDVVFQATFLDERAAVSWRGHADFLLRVDRPTPLLGDHGYEPADTKLARHVRPSAVLQLCEYAAQVERIQGVAPDRVHVVLGGEVVETIRLAEVSAYAALARGRFLAALGTGSDPDPVPCGHCPVCAWHPVCDERWERADHLSRVAGLSREQVRKLEAARVPTLRALAASPTRPRRPRHRPVDPAAPATAGPAPGAPHARRPPAVRGGDAHRASTAAWRRCRRPIPATSSTTSKATRTSATTGSSTCTASGGRATTAPSPTVRCGRTTPRASGGRSRS